MRVTGNMVENNAFYTDTLKNQVESTFDYAQKIAAINRLLEDIKGKARRLGELLLTEDEQTENREIMNNFDHKMQNLLYVTLGNLEAYQTGGWKTLFDITEDEDEHHS